MANRLFACGGCWRQLPHAHQRAITTALIGTVEHAEAMLAARRWYGLRLTDDGDESVALFELPPGGGAAVNATEARAVNTLLGWLLDLVDDVELVEAHAAARELADGAQRELRTGIGVVDVDERWPFLVGACAGAFESSDCDEPGCPCHDEPAAAPARPVETLVVTGGRL